VADARPSTSGYDKQKPTNAKIVVLAGHALLEHHSAASPGDF
jgi:hypothetical protein